MFRTKLNGGKMLQRRILATLATAVLAVPLVSCSGSSDGDGVLRIAMGSPGEAQIRVWNEAATQFEESHNVDVEINYQEDDLYETIGLPNLLNGKNPPDIYFEWAGNRLGLRINDGFAADLTEFVDSGPLAGLFDEETLQSVTVDGKVRMIPHAADVANVMWYNTDIFADNGLQPPETWDELLESCSVLNDAGVIPMASGNKDLWAAGNWLAHLTSRVVGEDTYSATLSGNESFDTPEWITAFQRVKDLADNNCVNDDINAINDTMGAQLFFQQKAAMHPIGSWLVSWAIDEAPDLNFDYFILPEMEGEGNQQSVMGVVTGHIINAQSSDEKQQLAAEFLALLYSDEYVEKWLGAELTPLTKSAQNVEDQDARITAMTTLLETAPALVLPPDTGYDLEVANAFYEGLAAVIGGHSTPEQAVATIDQKVG